MFSGAFTVCRVFRTTFSPASSLPERVDLPDVGNLYRDQHNYRKNDSHAGRNDIARTCQCSLPSRAKAAPTIGATIPHRRYERYSRKHQPDHAPGEGPVSNSDERRTNAHSLEKTIRTTNAAKIQNAVLNPRPTLTWHITPAHTP